MSRHRVARVVAMVFHPVVPGFVVALATSIAHEGGLTPRLLTIAALVSAVCIGLPLLTTYAFFRLGYLGDDLYLVRRESRWFLYPVVLVCLATTAGIFTWLYPFALARAMAVAALGASAVMAMGNRWLKPSIHCAGLAGIAVATGWVHGAWGLVVAALLPLVAWARIETTNHDLAETVVGTLIGASVTFAACFTMLEHLG